MDYLLETIFVVFYLTDKLLKFESLRIKNACQINKRRRL